VAGATTSAAGSSTTSTTATSSAATTSGASATTSTTAEPATAAAPTLDALGVETLRDIYEFDAQRVGITLTAAQHHCTVEAMFSALPAAPRADLVHDQPIQFAKDLPTAKRQQLAEKALGGCVGKGPVQATFAAELRSRGGKNVDCVAAHVAAGLDAATLWGFIYNTRTRAVDTVLHQAVDACR
jgi:hypothetical protein